MIRFDQSTSTGTTLNIQSRNYWNSQYGVLTNNEFSIVIY